MGTFWEDHADENFQGKKVLVVGYDRDGCNEFRKRGAKIWLVAPRDLGLGIGDHFIRSKIEDLSPVGIEGSFDLIYNQVVDREIPPTGWPALMNLFKTLLKRDGEAVQLCCPVMDHITKAYKAAFQTVDVYAPNSLGAWIHAKSPRNKILIIGVDNKAINHYLEQGAEVYVSDPIRPPKQAGVHHVKSPAELCADAPHLGTFDHVYSRIVGREVDWDEMLGQCKQLMKPEATMKIILIPVELPEAYVSCLRACEKHFTAVAASGDIAITKLLLHGQRNVHQDRLGARDSVSTVDRSRHG